MPGVSQRLAAAAAMPFYIDNITTGLQVNDNFDFLEYDKFMTVKQLY